MKKVILGGLFILCTIAAASQTDLGILASGECGIDARWELKDDGTLRISGSGDMYDWTWNGVENRTDVPWWEQRDKVRYVEVTGVNNLGNWAFSEFDSLRGVDISESVKVLGEDAFNGCDSLRDVKLKTGLESIGGGAFAECHGLRSLVIPASVDSIGFFTFLGCISLESCEIPEGVKEIGEGTFSNCVTLKEVVLPSTLTEIMDDGFIDCVSLDTIILPNRLKKIGWTAFAGCGSLKGVAIPDSVVELTDCAFSECKSLKNVTLPKDIKVINAHMFDGCVSLKSIEIPDSVIEIRNCAFMNCGALERMELPKGIEEIGYRVFAQCGGLKSMTVHALVPPLIYDDTFDGVSRGMNLEVPLSAKADYMSNAYWKEFLEGDVATKIDLETGDDDREERVRIYSERGRIVIEGGKEGETFRIYDISGKMVGEAKESIIVREGVYVVKGNSLVRKIVNKDL